VPNERKAIYSIERWEINMNKFDFKKFLAYLIITIVLGGCVGGIIFGMVLGGWQAFLVFLMALGIMVVGIGTMLAILWAAHYLTHN
jgi:hypothetical protein